MAILRAISGGNYWNTPEKWEVYNAQTNTWSAYNNSPQYGDYCYLNGYTLKISSSVEINIGNGTIDNVGNAEIGVSDGGAIDISAFTTRNVTANFVIGDQQMYRFAANSGNIWTFIGDITIVGTASFGGGAINGNNTINIIGNVTFKNASLLNLNTVISSLTITGNVTSEGGKLYNVATPVTINGNVTDLMLNSTTTLNGSYTLAQYNSDSDITATINGDLNLFNGHYLSCDTLNFYGDSIKYSGWATDSIGNLKVKDLNIGNLTNFTWHDVSVVRTAPFFIVTDYDLNNTNQYPTPANVKKDIPYAWGYMNGMMLPDYPQPANVLKDIEYGRHCAGRNDIVTYDNDRYIYVKTNGEYHWEIEHITSTDVTAVVDTAELSTAYKGVTTTDIVTNPTVNPVIINGTSTNISTDQYVRYGHSVYKWNGSEWILYQTDPKNVPTISIDGASVTADDGYVVKYTGNNKYYMWNSTDIEWQEQTMNYLGETTTDVTLLPSPQYVTLPYSISENSYIGTLDVPTTNVIIDAINQSTIGTNVGNISTAVTTIDGKVDIIDTNVDTLLSRLTSVLTQRLGQSVTVEILQQILIAHLDN